MDVPGIPAIRDELDARFAAREMAITTGRLVVRSSANAIRALHRSEWEAADAHIARAETGRDDILGALADQPAMVSAGFVSDAFKELAEAHLTRAMFRGRPLPEPHELDIDPIPWLHGLGEAVGELRRRLLDLLRAGEVDEAETIMQSMDDVVDRLAELDYPDGMTKGLRRTTDVARSLVERSRSDLTATVVQERLRAELGERSVHASD